jgi:4-methoxybenzoate monooxygenase (O-demethylating)
MISSIAVRPAELDADPYSVEVLSNPYPFFRALRNAGPIARIPKYGIYAVGRYAEVSEVLSDYDRFSSTSGVGLADARKAGTNARPRSALLEVDPPEHTRVRNVAKKIMSPGVVRTWREYFTAEAGELMQRLVAKGEFDGVAEAAEAFVSKVFPHVMGLNLDREAVRAIGFMTFNQTGPQNELYEQGIKVGAPYLEWFNQHCQRESVVAGGLADQLFAEEEAGRFDAGTASNIVRSFVRGGTDTTIAGIGFTLHELARNPDQWEILKNSPGRIKTVFDEAIRLESPFHVTYRVTTRACQLSGVDLEGDQKVAIFPGAANHDERKWDSPDRFDVTRQAGGVHMSFGTSDHNCIGQMIARAEAEALLQAFVKYCGSIRLAGEARYRLLNQVRTLDTLPLKVTQA